MTPQRFDDLNDALLDRLDKELEFLHKLEAALARDSMSVQLWYWGAYVVGPATLTVLLLWGAGLEVTMALRFTLAPTILLVFGQAASLIAGRAFVRGTSTEVADITTSLTELHGRIQRTRAQHTSNEQELK